MISPAYSRPVDGEAEALLGEALATADADLANVGPIVRDLLGAADPSPFSDRILAQVRAQLEDIGRQLLGGPERRVDPGQAALLGEAFVACPALLGHAHALALEAQLAERLANRIGLDPVAPPLVQTLIASPDPASAATAMKLLAAQARFGQAHRRGEMPLRELPGDLLELALGTARERGLLSAAAEQALRSGFDETASRLVLLDRAIAATGRESIAALNLRHAGVALFVTALATGAAIDRDTAVLATGEGQLARLALALVASGMSPEEAEGQLLALHPDADLPEGFDALTPDRAAALLKGAA